MQPFDVQLIGEEAMVAFGKQLGQACQPQRAVLFLEGDLGMGKTTLSRGILQAFGHQGAVKSPTYTLVEPYDFPSATVYHFDLYRLGDPEELEYLGIRDYFAQEQYLCLIEWAEKGGAFLPAADLVVKIELAKAGVNNEAADGRELSLVPQSTTGENIIATLQIDRIS